MNASEARETSINATVSENSETIDNIQRAIIKAAYSALMECNYYKKINTHVRSHFESKGFVVELIDSGRNESHYQISWYK